MSSFNCTIIEGRLGQDPELKYTTSGKALCNFTVAVDQRGKDAQTDWFRVTCWDKQADFCSQYLRKGREVLVRGRMQSRKYDNKDGVSVTAWELIADEVQAIGPRPDDDQAPQQRPAQQQPRQQAPQQRQQMTGRQAAAAYQPFPEEEDVPF